MQRLALVLAAALALACGSSSPAEDGPIPYGNPDGYAVHVLTGAGLSARAVTVNDLAVDTTSVETIHGSVQAILDETSAPTTVTEVTGVAPDLAVDFTGEATPVSPIFHGANLQWRSKFFLGDPRFKALVAHARIELLRFPGGQERVRYDGADSLSGTPASDTLTVAADQPYEFRLSGEDVAAFIGFCEELGIVAEPEINVTVDDADQAAAMIAQIVSPPLSYDLRYVSVGNEPDVHAARPGSPDGNWPYLGVTALDDDAVGRPQALAAYTARYLAYRARIEEVKPGLTYALGELGEWHQAAQGNYLDAILGAIGDDQPGAVAGHWYMTGDWGQPDHAYPDYPSLGHLVVDGNGDNHIWYLRTIAETMRARAAAHGLDEPALFLGEWGNSWSATPADAGISDRLAAAIFNAEAQETGKAAGFASMQWFGLSDPASFAPWVPSLIEVDDATGTPRPRPQYYVYLLYKHLYGDETVAVAGGQDHDVSIYASRAGERSYFMLINRTASRRVSRVVQVTTAAGSRLLRLTSYPHSIAVVEF